MFYLTSFLIIFLYGICHTYGFFHFRHQYYFDFNESESDSVNDGISWIEQPVDHFNHSDQRTWRMRYYNTTKYWKPGGPILLFLRGEVSLHLPEHNNSKMWLQEEIAQETNAAYFILEHRYYGKSKPFEELTTENLVFLTSRQALADAALLVETVKKSKEFNNSKVIVCGGSYAGNLAAWMKLLYPKLVTAVLASSAPVLAKKDFYEYLEVVTDTFRTYGSQDCVNHINKYFVTLHTLLESTDGIEQLKKMFNICKDVDMTVPENQHFFLFNHIAHFTFWAEYGTPADISDKCQDLNSIIINNDYLVWNEEHHCKDYNFYRTLNYLRGDKRSWIYQTCTEFGYLKSTASRKQMFGNLVPVDFFYKVCSGLFGKDFNEERVNQGVINTNKMYQGLTPKVQNVVFVNGDMDPWHRLSILKDLSPNVPAIYIMGSSHCHELAPNPNSDDVKQARAKIKTLLKKWIHEA